MKINFHEAHKRMWKWIAKEIYECSQYYNTEEDGLFTFMKNSWPEWTHNGGNIPSLKESRFACEAAFRRMPMSVPIVWERDYGAISTDPIPTIHYQQCDSCPLNWPRDKNCSKKYNFFNIVETTKWGDVELIVKAATLIANLEWNGEKIYDI